MILHGQVGVDGNQINQDFTLEQPMLYSLRPNQYTHNIQIKSCALFLKCAFFALKREND